MINFSRIRHSFALASAGCFALALAAVAWSSSDSPRPGPQKPPPQRRDRAPQEDFLKSGRELFRVNCSLCHGVDGTGAWGNKKGSVKPQDLTLTEWDPMYVIKVIENGIPGSDMKPFPAMPRKTKVAIAFFVYSLWEPELEPSGSGADSLLDRGMVIYEKNCLRCHGPSGDGNGKDAKNLKPKPAPFKHQRPNLETIVRALEKGVPGTAMVPFNRLNLTDKYAVGVYLQTLFRENGAYIPD